MLVIVCGLQGSGKSAVAERIAKKLGAELLQTDVIRKEILKEPKFIPEEKPLVYGEFFSRAGKALKKSKDVVMDATFAMGEDREQARRLAKDAKTGFKVVEVVCDEGVVKKRLGERFSKDKSTAEFRVYLKYKKLFEPISDKHIIIDNSGTVKDMEKQVAQYF